jgi:hypothetical protein
MINSVCLQANLKRQFMGLIATKFNWFEISMHSQAGAWERD